MGASGIDLHQLCALNPSSVRWQCESAQHHMSQKVLVALFYLNQGSFCTLAISPDDPAHEMQWPAAVIIIQTPQAKLYLYCIMDTQLRTHSNQSNLPLEWYWGPGPSSEGNHQQQEPTWQTSDTIDSLWQNSADPPSDQIEWCSKSCKYWAKIATTHTWPRFKNWTIAAIMNSPAPCHWWSWRAAAPPWNIQTKHWPANIQMTQMTQLTQIICQWDMFTN